MDEAALRRQLDALTPAPTDAALRAARRSLEVRIAAAMRSPIRPAGRRRTRRLVIGGLGAAAAGAAAVVVGASLGPAPAASADASRALRGAAEAVSSRSVPTTGVREHRHMRVTALIFGEHAAALASSVLLDRDVTLRMSDRAGVWERITSPSTPIGAWGPEQDGLLRGFPDKESVERSDSGSNFWLQDNAVVSPESIASTPRETTALLAELTRVTDPDSSLQQRSERAIDRASALLGSGLADADLQAAVYRALEQLPGLLVDRHAADIDGRPGVGIGVLTSGGRQRVDLIIEPSTGRYLGRTETDLVPSGGAPAGTIEDGTAVYPLTSGAR